MFKKILIGVVALLVIVGVGAYYLLSNLDGYVKSAIEKYGTEATQADVKVGGVKIGLRDGSGQITNLTLGNPKGFSSPNAFTLGEVKVVIDPASVTGDVIHIKEIVIDKPQVTYEPNLGGGGNLETIQKNVSAYAAKMGGGKPAAASEPKSEKKLIIDRVSIRGGQVTLSNEALSRTTGNASVGLPAINLHDIGKAKGGATPAEVTSEILGALSQQATRAAVSGFSGVLNGLRNGAGDVGGAVGGAAGGAADQLRGLLGR